MKGQTQGDAGEQVLKQGWPGRSMYFVRSGFVDLVMDGAVVDTIQAGDYFGEVALLALPPTHELLQVHIITVHAHCCRMLTGTFSRSCPKLRGLLLAVLQAATPACSLQHSKQQLVTTWSRVCTPHCGSRH